MTVKLPLVPWLVGILSTAVPPLSVAGAQTPAAGASIRGAESAGGAEYRPRETLRDGREIVAVIIGASWCGPSNLPPVVDALRRAKSLLAQQAAAQGASFSVTAASLDWDMVKGTEYLAKIGPVDEVSIGRNWLNGAAIEHIWRDSSGVATTPQILVFEQNVSLGRRIDVSRRRVLMRLSSSQAIVDWVAQGAPLTTGQSK